MNETRLIFSIIAGTAFAIWVWYWLDARVPKDRPRRKGKR